MRFYLFSGDSLILHRTQHCFGLFGLVVDFYDHAKYINRWLKQKKKQKYPNWIIATQRELVMKMALIFLLFDFAAFSFDKWNWHFPFGMTFYLHIKYNFFFPFWFLFLFRFYFMDWFFRLAVCCLTIFTEFRLLQLLRTLFMMYGSVFCRCP